MKVIPEEIPNAKIAFPNISRRRGSSLHPDSARSSIISDSAHHINEKKSRGSSMWRRLSSFTTETFAILHRESWISDDAFTKRRRNLKRIFDKIAGDDERLQKEELKEW